MSINEMNLEEIEARSLEISTEMAEASEERLAELKAEALELESRTAELKDLEARKSTAEAITNCDVIADTIEERKENKTMTSIEMRNSFEYGKAFIQGIKTDDYAECRKLMTTEATVAEGDSVSTNVIPVPTMLENEIKTAWETYKVASLVKKSAQKGNVKVVWEVSATGAVVHVEGTSAPTEEKVVLGSRTLTNGIIKKWITITDEAIENTTIDTIGYLYKEIAQKIVEKAEDAIITNIVGEQASTDATHPGVPVLAQNIAVDTILNAEALLSGNAKKINIVMNRQTYPAFVKLALEAGYAIDVFDGLKDKIVFSDKLPAFSSASTNATYVIIGDFSYGYQCNFPNGNNVTIKKDDLSLAEYDLVKLVGKQNVGHGVVAPKALVKITKVATA